ncbi:MAG: hypothetical protein LQ350_008076 [Teloschistes chrysophthalmus]|nr:MAG: hypothetical protein LQ350_008076 [Niorma chrysophthalma]
MNYERRIGYYELFNVHERQCDKVYPEDLEVAPLTHINLAFVNFDSNFKMIDTDGELISRVSFLKSRYQGLRVNVAIGGWVFNDPPTETLFSDMASTYSNRRTFTTSLVSFIQKYGLDGVDIDWEYPVAPDRGGKPEDTDNYVLLMSDIRDAFDAVNPAWGDYVDYFNVMSYDMHGMWDQHNKFTGPYLQGHTNITEIEQGLDLLWRNGVGPNKVVMGFAFYGRSFTMEDPGCSKPGCRFSTSGEPGSCTNTGGILSYSELSSRNSSLDVHTFYDQKSTVKYNTYNGNQWISYDDAQSFLEKKKYLTSRCLGGLMIWAIDQDNQNHGALSGLLGDFSSSQLEGGGLDDKSAAALSDAFGAYTGQNCFVTPTCTDGTDGQKQKDQVCPSGFMDVSTAHAPKQAQGYELHGTCDEGWFRKICCPAKAMPKNCKWIGAPEQSEFGCSGGCSKTQFRLNTDPFTDDKGKGQCFTGTRNLCCDSTQALDGCYWTGCKGPYNPLDAPECDHPDDVYQTFRFEDENGNFCSDSYVSPVGGSVGSPLTDRFKQGFCCPKGKGFKQCNWSNDPPVKPGQPAIVGDPRLTCQPKPCKKGQTKVTEALHPPPSKQDAGIAEGICDGFSIPPGFEDHFPYCCQPPSKYSSDWPVDPKDLFEQYYNDADDDVMWSYDNEYRNNNEDKSQSNPGDEDGKDAYGFVMLDGPPGSLDNDFPNSHTITRRTVEMPKVKRSLLTTNHTVIGKTFEHSEEIVYVYCNTPQESKECQKVWYKGVKDTIIRLPAHVGEGPYARIVSMQLAEPEYQLPLHHVEARSLDENKSPVYKLTFDYDFHLIKRDDVVNMRVDFTNLLGYWDDVTDEPASKRKRDMYADHLSEQQWRGKIGKAKHRHATLRKGREARAGDAQETEMVDHKPMERRWFGKFLDWLGKLNTVEDKNVGYLSMALKKSLLLFSAAVGCPGNTFSAQMKLYLDADVEMEATYAYYFSGTIVPPVVTGTYAFFSLEPSAYLGLRMTGNARMQAGTGRKKLLDTISYPGLAIKGIAAVGPTLDLYGEIRGVVTLKGEMKAGAKLNFGKAEVYWPQDDSAKDKYETLLGLESKSSAAPQDVIAPTFDAKVRIDAAIDINVTPEANMGIRVGGKISGGSPLVDAQLVGFVNTTLRFSAYAEGDVSSDTAPASSYGYGVYFLYNLGYGAYASIKFFPNWALKPRNVFNPMKQVTIYKKSGSFTGVTKRTIDPPDILLGPRIPRRGLLDDWEGAEISPIDDVHESYAMDIRNLLGKRADGSLPTTQPGFSTAQLACPPGNTPQIRIPDFRLSCTAMFVDSQVAGANVPGICTGIRDWYLAGGLANSAVTLTWDTNKKRSDTRRGQTCGDSYCGPEQTRLRGLTGDRSLEISCDEFPFASSEEGGDFYSTLTTNPRQASKVCVPRWQQQHQSNCNRMLSNIETNIGYLDRKAGTPNAPDAWLAWNSENWVTDGASLAGAGPQRQITYPNQAYLSANRALGYMYKRNFTFGLATPTSRQDGGQWSAGNNKATGWLRKSTGEFDVGTDGGDVREIACAVNTFGQNDIFRYGFNGLCYNGGNIPGWGFGSPPNLAQCIIEFAPNQAAPGGTKHKRSLGQFNGYDVLSIKYLVGAQEES